MLVWAVVGLLLLAAGYCTVVWLRADANDDALRTILKTRARLARWADAVRPSNKDAAALKRWTTAAIKASDLVPAGQQLTSVEVGPAPGAAGLVGTVQRVTYAAGDRKGTLFLKTTVARDASSRMSALISSKWREPWFYANRDGVQRKAPDFFAATLPRVIRGEWDAVSCMATLLMEDLSDTATRMTSIYGNQCWGGVTPAPAAEQRERLRDVFAAAADMHAAYWCNRDLLTKWTWLKGSDWLQGRGRATWEAGLEAARRSWAAAKAAGKIAERSAAGKATGTTAVAVGAGAAAGAKPAGGAVGEDGPVLFSPRLWEVIEEALEDSSWEDLQVHVTDDETPFTLTHGDYHAGNMLYRKSGGATGQRLVIVDWSECGPWEPAVDLAQTIISDVRPEVWRGKDQALVRSYYDRLIRNGVDAEKYDWERCWDDYRRTGIEKWVFILCILASYPMPRVGLAYFVSQVEAFLGAHDAWEGYTIKQVIPIV